MCTHVYVCVRACVCVCMRQTKSKEIQFRYKSVLLSSEFKFPKDVASFREFVALFGIDPGVYSEWEREREREREGERERGREREREREKRERNKEREEDPSHRKFGMAKSMNSKAYEKSAGLPQWNEVTRTNTVHQCTGAPHSDRRLLLHSTIKLCYDQNSSSKVQLWMLTQYMGKRYKKNSCLPALYLWEL